MSKKPIFLHSLFRTGSTYFWNTFRKNSRYCCYYEPLHQGFVSLSLEHPDLWDYSKSVTQQMHFPDLDKSLTFEYRDLFVPGKKGLPLFEKSFSFDEYCHNGSNSKLKKYLDSLIENAKDKIPVLQFNRSPLRIKWFQSNYPDALHVYLVRHPHEQFQSYISMMKLNELDIFFIMDLMIAGKNQNSGMFRLLASRISLVDFRNDDFEKEEFVYRILSRCYSAWEKYYVFYFIWLYSFYENVLNADFVVNMDYLTSDLAYRSKVVYLLKRFDIADISFDNANIQKYRTFLLRKEVMGEIEQEIQDLFSQYIGRKSQKRIFSKISRAERDFFAIPKTIHIKFKRYRLEDLPERDSYPFDESVKALVEKLIRRSKLAEILEIDLQRAASKLVREQQEMNESIRKMDRMRDHQISKFRDIHLMKELEEIEKISKELVRQSELLDQQKKEFKLERPVEGRGKKPDVKVGQRYKEMQDELEKTAIWFERRIRGLKKRKSLLTKKSELIQKIKKIAGR